MARPPRDTAATRRRLLAAARAAFAAAGYAEASTTEIVERSQVTRGALYHHFRDKADLFRAVVEEIQEEIGAHVRAATRGAPDTVAAMRIGFQAYLDKCLEPDVARIVLTDGPAVLGWEVWSEIDRRHAYRLTRAAVETAIGEGRFVAGPVDAMTAVLLGAVTQASLDLGRSPDPAAMRRQLGEAIDLLLDHLTL